MARNKTTESVRRSTRVPRKRQVEKKSAGQRRKNKTSDKNLARNKKLTKKSTGSIKLTGKNKTCNKSLEQQFKNTSVQVTAPVKSQSLLRSAERTDRSPSTGRSRKSSANEKGMSTRNRSRSNHSANRSPLLEKTVISSEKSVPKIYKKIVAGRIVDCYCWTCHKVVDEESPFSCSCSRTYHQECLKKLKTVSETNFCECHTTIVDGRKDEIVWHPVELKEMLQYAMQEAVKEEKKIPQKKHQSGETKFCQLFKSWPQTEETDGLCKVVDLDFLIDKMNIAPPYSSTGQFYMDVKWIYHNCCIVYGFDSEVTHAAQLLEKNFKQELIDIEACRECYKRKHTEPMHMNLHEDFFTTICRNPHPIVWAKLRGSPFWPAKCLVVHNGQADVRFFGTHDKSNIPLSQVFKISRLPPNKTPGCRKAKYQEAMTELDIYVDNYQNKIGEFRYYEARTPFVEHSTLKSQNRRHGKRKRSRTRRTEQVFRNEDTSEDELASPEISMEENEESSFHKETDEISLSKESKGTDSKKNLKPLLNVSVLHDDLVESKAVFHQPSVSTVPAEERNIESSSNVVCHMTFSEEDENCQMEVHPSEEFVQSSSTSPCSETSERASLPSHNGSSDLSPEMQLTSECVNPSESSEQHYINASTSSSLPVITSTMSPFVISATHSGYENADDISAHISASAAKDASHQSDFTNDSVSSLEDATNRKKLLTHITDHILKSSDEDEDEIQLIEETQKTSLVDSVLKNETLTRTLCELLLSNRPTMREHFLTFQNMALRSYLTMWLEVNSMRLEGDDCKSFQAIYETLLKKSGRYKAKNEELTLEVEKLKKEKEELEAELAQKSIQEDYKKKLQSTIVSAASEKINSIEIRKHTDTIIILQEQIKRLEKQNEEMKESHSLEVETAQKKFLSAEDEIKELKKKVDDLETKLSECQKEIIVAPAPPEKIVKDNSKALVAYKSQDLSHLLGSSHNSLALLQQSGLQAPVSSGTLMNENFMMTKYPYMPPAAHQLSAVRPIVQLPIGLPSILSNPTCLANPYQQPGISANYELPSTSSGYRQSGTSAKRINSPRQTSRGAKNTSRKRKTQEY